MNERRPPNQPGPGDDRKPSNPSGLAHEAKQPEQSRPSDTNLTDSAKPSGAALSRQVQAKLGQQLRSYYERLIEPPPDRFVDLLRRLDKPGSKDPQG